MPAMMTVAGKPGVSRTSAACKGLGDPDRLVQATTNLIENALRRTPAGGTVTVSGRPGEIWVPA